MKFTCTRQNYIAKYHAEIMHYFKMKSISQAGYSRLDMSQNMVKDLNNIFTIEDLNYKIEHLSNWLSDYIDDSTWDLCVNSLTKRFHRIRKRKKT